MLAIQGHGQGEKSAAAWDPGKGHRPAGVAIAPADLGARAPLHAPRRPFTGPARPFMPRPRPRSLVGAPGFRMSHSRPAPCAHLGHGGARGRQSSAPRPSAPSRLLFLLLTWWPLVPQPACGPSARHWPSCRCPASSSSRLSTGTSARPSLLRSRLQCCLRTCPSWRGEASMASERFLFFLLLLPGGAAAAGHVSEPCPWVAPLRLFFLFLPRLWGGWLASGSWRGGAREPPLT